MQTLPELLRLPDVPLVMFERSPLGLVLCQIRFASVLGVADETIAAKFQKAIQADYPFATPAGQVELQLPLAAGTASFKQGRIWQFSDPDDNWKVVLAQDFLTVETRSYESFVDFLDRLQSVLRALAEHVAPPVITRIGLRYVNEIRVSHRRWDTVIRGELLGPLAIPELAGNVELSAQELALRYPHGQGINVRHGLLPQGTTVQPRQGEGPPTGPFYLLDFDAFREFSPPDALKMDVNVISDHVASFNKAIYRVFCWSVTEDYISTLGLRGDDGD